MPFSNSLPLSVHQLEFVTKWKSWVSRCSSLVNNKSNLQEKPKLLTKLLLTPQSTVFSQKRLITETSYNWNCCQACMKNLGKKKKRFLQEFMNCNDDVLFLAHISNAMHIFFVLYLFCFCQSYITSGYIQYSIHI